MKAAELEINSALPEDGVPRTDFQYSTNIEWGGDGRPWRARMRLRTLGICRAEARRYGLRKSSSFRNASPRCETANFSSALSSARVFSKGG